jgi:predicted lipoprotein with Yx(FWY)xxD motif
MTVFGTRSTTYAVAAASLAVLAAACGSSSSGTGTQAVEPAAGGGSSSAATSSATTTHSTSVGTVLADSRGRTIYELVGDTAANPKCASSCQAIWPPVMSGGKLLVVHGHPAFTFVGDSASGTAKGEGSKDSWGVWLALKPNGTPIAAAQAAPPAAPVSSAPAASSSSASSGGSGGYGY